jgi:hypothetical protein
VLALAYPALTINFRNISKSLNSVPDGNESSKYHANTEFTRVDTRKSTNLFIKETNFINFRSEFSSVWIWITVSGFALSGFLQYGAQWP